jgi:hypothetical protein
LYGAQICKLLKVDQKCLNVLKCGAGEEWRRSFVMNEVLLGHTEERIILHTVKRRQGKYIGQILSKSCLLKHVIKGKI